MTYSNGSVKEDLKLVEKETGITTDKDLLWKYQCGVIPNLLVYEKLDTQSPALPVLQKYLIGTASSFVQPATYYDIFRACRSVNMMRALARAIRSGVTTIPNWSHKLNALKNSVKFDVFDETLFEIVTAAAYLRHPQTESIRFIVEKSKTVPDLVINSGNKEFAVECKKFNRQTNFSVELREDVRTCLNKVVRSTIPLRRSNVGEITFHRDPKLISTEALIKDYLSALQRGVEFEREDYTICGTFIPPSKNDEYVLFNSPKYYQDRYGFNGEDWIGVVAVVHGKPCIHVDFADPESKESSWFDTVNWESAIKWSISDSAMEWRLKKMNYSSVFQSLKQISLNSHDSQVHFWIERDPAIGHRQKEIIHLTNAVGESGLPFGWLIFNETISRVTPDGYFDFWEHSHPIGHKSGPERPFLKSVFTTDEDFVSDSGAFGIGTS